MKRNGDKNGVVLLLTLMVLAILIVVVGQFSTTAVLDWKIAGNRKREVQLSLDTRSGMEAALTALSARGEEEEGDVSLFLKREDSDVSVQIEDETGKFNINSLINPPDSISPDRAETVLRRLLDLADDPPGTLPPGMADGIVAKVREGGRPVPTLASLQEVEGITPEVLWGEKGVEGGNPGLSRLLTVHGDGRIRPGVGDDMVLLALSNKLTPRILEMTLAYIRNPTPSPPPQVAQLAQDVLPWTTWKSQAYTADISARREGSVKRVRVAISVKEDGLEIISHDELN